MRTKVACLELYSGNPEFLIFFSSQRIHEPSFFCTSLFPVGFLMQSISISFFSFEFFLCPVDSHVSVLSVPVDPLIPLQNHYLICTFTLPYSYPDSSISASWLMVPHGQPCPTLFLGSPQERPSAFSRTTLAHGIVQNLQNPMAKNKENTNHFV